MNLIQQDEGTSSIIILEDTECGYGISKLRQIDCHTFERDFEDARKWSGSRIEAVANRCPDEKCQERELQGENEKRNCLVVASFSSAAEGRHKDEFKIVGH